MRRLWIGVLALAPVIVAAIAFDVWRQYSDQGPAAVLGGTVLVIAFLFAFGAPVVVVLGLAGAEAYALWDLGRRRDLPTGKRVLWLSVVVILTPWFAAGALAYLALRRRPQRAAAG